MNLKKPEIPGTVDEVDWSSWQPTERAVLCYLTSDDHLLLIHKKTGLGAGKVNAPGGRIDPGETPLEAAVRETEEETGIIPLDPVQRAEVSFIFTNGYSLKGEIFFARNYGGTMLKETKEAIPFWCPVNEIPYADMWEDDIHWLPLALGGQYVRGFFIFDEDKMLSHRIVSP
ncbi:MAG: 8-oxo-dGTP diphosphatase [Spirochaetales bacterium]|nr:MAG: 8-oxo-dGTP diphosphatase [Spirochaetales bacterium]